MLALNELLQGCTSHGKKKRVSSQANDTKPCFRPAEPFGPQWSDQCESAFQELKIRLTQAPMLTFADPQKPYVLHVDASMDRLGGVLYQEHNDGLCPVAFISRSLSPSEKNYQLISWNF